MVLALVLITLVVFVLFMLTWKVISWKADEGQYVATCSRIDSDRVKLRHLERLHEGYGPTKQHVPALDQIVTLQLYPKAPGGKGDGYFVIPSPGIGYAMKATDSSCTDKPHSTERSITLRELLNRLLKDVPVQLVHSVSEDWKFVEVPPPALPYVLHTPAPGIDNRPHPLDDIGVALGGLRGAFGGPATAPFPLFNDHN